MDDTTRISQDPILFEKKSEEEQTFSPLASRANDVFRFLSIDEDDGELLVCVGLFA